MVKEVNDPVIRRVNAISKLPAMAVYNAYVMI
jgi:hypothetical protein